MKSQLPQRSGENSLSRAYREGVQAVALGLAAVGLIYLVGSSVVNRTRAEFQSAKEALETLPIERAHVKEGQGIDSFTAETVSVSNFPRDVRRAVYDKQNGSGTVYSTDCPWRPYEITPARIAENKAENARWAKMIEQGKTADLEKELELATLQ